MDSVFNIFQYLYIHMCYICFNHSFIHPVASPFFVSPSLCQVSLKNLKNKCCQVTSMTCGMPSSRYSPLRLVYIKETFGRFRVPRSTRKTRERKGKLYGIRCEATQRQHSNTSLISFGIRCTWNLYCNLKLRLMIMVRFIMTANTDSSSTVPEFQRAKSPRPEGHDLTLAETDARADLLPLPAYLFFVNEDRYPPDTQ